MSHIWNKIKFFFEKLFKKKEVKMIEEVNLTNSVDRKVDFNNKISVREEIEEKRIKEEKLQRLINKEIFPYELTDEEIEEMIEYVKKDTEEKDKEFNRVKDNIIKMKKELESKK